VGVLQEVPLDGSRALQLHVDGDTARLVLFDRAQHREVFAIPFEVTVAALRAALGAALRVVARTTAPAASPVAPGPAEAPDAGALWARIEAAWQRAWEFAPDDPHGDPDVATATVIAGEYPGQEQLAHLIATGQGAEAERRVSYMERRVEAAVRGVADLARVPLDAHVAPPGAFAAFLAEIQRREADRAAAAAQHAAFTRTFSVPAAEPRRLGNLDAIYRWYKYLPSSYRVTPRDFTSPVVVPWGSWTMVLTPRAAGAMPWSTIFGYLRLDPREVQEWLTGAFNDAAKHKYDRDAAVALDMPIRWAVGEPPTPFVATLDLTTDVITVDVPPKPNSGDSGDMGAMVAEHVGLEVGLEREHHPRARRRR
jgi:hypothetical protein